MSVYVTETALNFLIALAVMEAILSNTYGFQASNFLRNYATSSLELSFRDICR